MSPVMEPGGCRIASPAWQTKSLGTRRQYSQATVNNVLPLITDSLTFLTRPPNIAHSAWMHGTLWNAIFTSLIASDIDVIDTLLFNNDVDYLYQLATVLEMRLNHEYWCEPECTWQTNSINKTNTSERLDSWASRLWRGIELVFKSLDCFTVRPIFSTRPITRKKSFSFYSFIHLFIYFLRVLSSNAFTIWCCIPIIRPPRVIRRFKRRSCLLWCERSKAKKQEQSDLNRTSVEQIIALFGKLSMWYAGTGMISRTSYQVLES